MSRSQPKERLHALSKIHLELRTFVMAHKLFKIGGLKGVDTLDDLPKALGEGITDPLAVNYYKFLAEGGFSDTEDK